MALIHEFFKDLLASSKNPEETTLKCLTIQVYAQEALKKLTFLDPETTCPCFLQRLCFMVADEQAEREDQGEGEGEEETTTTAEGEGKPEDDA